jgi:hypothetical protein
LRIGLLRLTFEKSPFVKPLTANSSAASKKLFRDSLEK